MINRIITATGRVGWEERIALQSIKEHPASLCDRADNHSSWESRVGGEDSLQSVREHQQACVINQIITAAGRVGWRRG